MSKYIDAEWLKELYKPYESYNGKELAVPIGAILANIGDAPSIDICFCKDCVSADGKPIADGRYWCNNHGCYMRFCSYGEREGE